MPRIHDVMAVHGVGEQRQGDTLSDFAEQFYKGVRWMVQESGQDPNQVELFGRFRENRIEIHYRDEVFRLWEISWERSFRTPSGGQVLDWLGLWSSQYLNRAFRQSQGKEAQQHGHGPWPRILWLLALLLDLTLVVPLLAALFWVWAARAQVRYQKSHDDLVDKKILTRHRLATGLALTLSTPLIVGLHYLAQVARLASRLPIVGGAADRLRQSVEDLMVGSLGDILLYVFDPIQSAFIRGDLERAIQEAHDQAQNEGRDPLIHVIGHSMGSVIAYEVASRSLALGLRRSVKTLCTMGTVLDMIRYILGGEGLVMAERVRFSGDIPREKQGKTYPRWLNLFARNDPATGFSPLLEFGTDPTNQAVCSTPKGHSTYWTDVRGVYRPFLAWITQGNPTFDKPTPPPPLDCQASIAKDVGQVLGKLTLSVLLIIGAALLSAWYFDVSLTQVAGRLDQLLRELTLPWPLSWLVIAAIWLLSSLVELILSLPGWYGEWLIWLSFAFVVWAALALPSMFRSLWSWLEYRRRVPLDQDAKLNHWVGALQEVGPLYELTLRKTGIWTIRDFMVAAVRPGGSIRLAKSLHVSEEWVQARMRQANLMRLKGIGPERAALLLAVGIDSLETLGQQEWDELLEKMAASLEKVELSRVPAGKQIQEWIERAQSLQDVV